MIPSTESLRLFCWRRRCGGLLSTRVAIRFLHYGCQVSAICPPLAEKATFCGTSGDWMQSFRIKSLDSLSSLESAIRQVVPDIVIPCDDRVVWQLHELHRLKPDLRPLIETSLGAADGFERVERRDLLLESARALGICIPTTKCVTSEDDIHSWFAEGARSAVLKLDGTWGGEGVAIARSEPEAIDAFRRFSQPSGIATAIKRFMVNREPPPLANRGKQARPSIILQQVIEGSPANSMMACWKGEILSIVSVEVLASQGATGAAFLVRMFENDDMTRAAVLLAKSLHLSGFFGLDFLIDQSTGQPHLIEMNPRCTQLGHLPLPGRTDLVGALCAKLSGKACVSGEAYVEGRVIAFFPQAGQWYSKSPLPSGVYNDVPEGQPELVRELRRPSWPERKWISRIYHLFRPPRAVEPVEFSSETRERAPISQT